MSGISRKILSASGASEYWIGLLDGTNFEYFLDAAADSQNNIIACGFTDSEGSGNDDALLVKYDKLGNLQWKKILGDVSNNLFAGVAVDSGDNIFCFGRTVLGGTQGGLVVKYNSSGVVQWQKQLRDNGTDLFNHGAVDGSGNVIAVGQTSSDGAGDSDGLIAKYNTSGTLLWQKTLGGSGTDFLLGCAIDSSDNIIAVGHTTSDGAGSYDILVAKFNSSGTLLWDKTLGGAQNDFGFSVSVDSGDNIIITGGTESDGAGNEDLLVAKYNSSGTLLWDRTLGGASDDQGRAAVVDSSDNIFVFGSTGTEILVAKYNSSGSFLWSKSLDQILTNVAYGATIDSNDNIVACGYARQSSSDLDCIIAKLPPNGSGDGSYGLYTYQDVTLTDAAAVLTDAAAVLTLATSTLIDSAISLTAGDSSLTEEFLPITP